MEKIWKKKAKKRLTQEQKTVSISLALIPAAVNDSRNCSGIRAWPTPLIFGIKWKRRRYMTAIYMERYRSGHNEAVLKTVCP
ncbi:MAG: hypothetical protein LUH53_04040, partial [Lachnospiraceae bacterium]|nr:hypothetical protein [Lachnospiraceae bacterium]